MFLTSSSSVESPIAFHCNICGSANQRPRSDFGREKATCDKCGSTVRTRGIIHMLSMEILGIGIALPDFPVMKAVRGLGMSDSPDYSRRLTEKFDYRNTEYDREPKLDILRPGPEHLGKYDFIVSSEVLEHVVAPVAVAFENLLKMLKPAGVLLMTVPYKPEGTTVEHFGPMADFGLSYLGGQTVLVRRNPSGEYEVIDGLVFHGGSGSTLEMRVFAEADLLATIRSAGFSSAEIHSRSVPEFGILQAETWSLPIVARKEPFRLPQDAIRGWADQWVKLRVGLDAVPREAYQSIQAELVARTEWALEQEKTARERTDWALRLDREIKELGQRAARLQSELDSAQLHGANSDARIADLERRRWIRLGRKLGLLRKF